MRATKMFAALSIATLTLLASPARADDPIVVTNVQELEAALSPANAGRRILVQAGQYPVSQALVVPDGATLEGEGVMLFDPASGLPSGFDPAGLTEIKATAGVVGDMLTMGSNTMLRGLQIEDLTGRAGGSVVVVASRAPADSVAASIRECEIRSPNPSGIAPGGPTGRALAVFSRNPNLGQAPPAHDDSSLEVDLDSSIIRAPRASAVFSHNFSSRSQIAVAITSSLVVGGGIDAVGGVSRPDAVSGSRVTIRSRSNLYRPDPAFAATTNGWAAFGATGAPYPGMVPQETTFNTIVVHSVDDRLEGFRTAIAARGAARLNVSAAATSWNHADLDVHGLRMTSLVADLILFGGAAVSGPDDGNTARVLIRGVEGSGPRANQYVHGAFGVGNRLEIVGSPTAFAQTNTMIEPPPPDEFFTSAH